MNTTLKTTVVVTAGHIELPTVHVAGKGLTVAQSGDAYLVVLHGTPLCKGTDFADLRRKAYLVNQSCLHGVLRKTAAGERVTVLDDRSQTALKTALGEDALSRYQAYVAKLLPQAPVAAPEPEPEPAPAKPRRTAKQTVTVPDVVFYTE